MKWFTRDWERGSLSATETTRRELDYLEHLESLDRRARLAFSGVVLRGGRVQAWAFRDQPPTLLFSVLVSSADGYELVDLRFEGVSLPDKRVPRDLIDLRLTSTGRWIAATEQDHGDAQPEFRILFAPAGELAFTYDGVVIRRAPASQGGTVAAIDR